MPITLNDSDVRNIIQGINAYGYSDLFCECGADLKEFLKQFFGAAKMPRKRSAQSQTRVVCESKSKASVKAKKSSPTTSPPRGGSRIFSVVKVDTRKYPHSTSYKADQPLDAAKKAGPAIVKKNGLKKDVTFKFALQEKEGRLWSGYTYKNGVVTKGRKT